ncbi:MAG: SRPBCC family protein [Cyanobacteria bacterium P01_A01_bin.40]
MASIYKQFQINAPSDRVWSKMSDLGEVHGLLGMLTDAKINGDTRICKTQSGNSLKELIISVDSEHKRMVYAITESPFNFEFHVASWQAIPDGDSIIFEWYTDLKPDNLAETIEIIIDGAQENIINGLSA